MHVYIYAYIFKVQSLKKKIYEVSNKPYLFEIIPFSSPAFR